MSDGSLSDFLLVHVSSGVSISLTEDEFHKLVEIVAEHMGMLKERMESLTLQPS